MQKLLNYLAHASRIPFPVFSKRRLFIKIAIKFIKHPKLFLLKFPPNKLKHLLYLLRTEGTPGVIRRLDVHMPGGKSQRNPLEIVDVKKEMYNTVDTLAPLVFKNHAEPFVTIIIPVYNQFEYTYHCLSSILKFSGDSISYEIIIADDCSIDLTTEIKKIVQNIQVIRNATNLRFLKNCNQAAKYARGKYLLFLNNDTQVQSNWLEPLVALLESNETVGAVGSKLVYSDGRLQEAGGIIWADGSGWNYGRMMDCEAPEYNYVKEVDYISGASLMIRTSIWKMLGGFDEYFEPAYAEDSDICFSIRKLGYKVVYQPDSIVVHFEGISNGIDMNEGQKKYQIVNGKKLFKKWKDIFTTEQFPNAEDVFLARDRTKGKKNLLMIDCYAPQYDKDAGSRTIFHYLKLFVKLGFNVKFIPDNFYKHEHYVNTLQQMGIEVLYGPDMALGWKVWLKTYGKYFHYVFISRPEIAAKYINEVKKHTVAKIFFYGHDLHFLRLEREYEIYRKKSILKNSKKFKKLETQIMSQVDVAYYPSALEIKEIEKLGLNVKTKAIPAYIYQNPSTRELSGTKDIMFIGGFSHKPNVDAVLWYAKEIFPEVLKKLPNIKTYIIGSNVPEIITALNSDNLVVTGAVSDEELNLLYKSCRISVVPLRYGAGVKGKVVEAMFHGIAVITTPVGAEGIPESKNCLFIKENASDFANEIIRIYDNLELLTKFASKENEVIKKHFSIDTVLESIKADLAI